MRLGDVRMQALVTGATSGIGRAIALALHGAGYQVTGWGRQDAALRALRAMGLRAQSVDVADRAAVLAALNGLEPDVLVNNAGMMQSLVPFCDLDQDEIDRMLEVNLGSVLALTRAVAPGMQGRGRGHILFTGSTAGHTAYANFSVYSTTKAALAGFAQALRMDMAPHGVRITEIVAGRVETALYQHQLTPETRAAMYANGSAVQPADVAAMVLAVLAMPPHVDVARFDILPTQHASAVPQRRDR
jgi:3-hydroxy acid dehydrogenase / malonic semialdehyde reductase